MTGAVGANCRFPALLLAGFFFAPPANAFTPSDIYAAVSVVTGQGVENRAKGFVDCLDKVLPRVSGSSRLSEGAEMQTARKHAADYIESFSYHDRLAGRPIHDEQGTHDRPHDLTCHFRKDSIDDLLGRLGVRPWLDKRPVLGVLLKVRRGQASYQVAAGNSRDLAMREAFAAASDLTGIDVVFPSGEYTGLRSVEGTMPLSGELDWSDSEGGWIATWELDVQQSANKLHEARWQVRGVSFDDAFRNALKGAAQILSGNGKPVGALTHAEK